MRFASAHLRDDHLLALYFGGEDSSANATLAHLAACGVCARRFEQITADLETLRHEAAAEADQAFDSDRLLRQRDHILKRIEHAGQPARVIDFPLRSLGMVVEHGTQRLMLRWIAAAAVAGLLVGLGAGLLVDRRVERSLAGGSVARSGSRIPPTSVALSTRTAALQGYLPDDEFLFEIEAALGAPRAPELQAIDAFTPSLRDVAVNLR